VRGSEVFRARYLLPLACAASAICVGASELMTMFEFKRGGELLKVIDSADRHHYALLVLAIFAIVFLVIAVLTGSRPAATGVAVVGVISLLIFLTVDVPDVNQQGSLDDPSFEFFSSKAEPANGFWFALAGTLGLALSGVALATLRPDQLRLTRPGEQPFDQDAEARQRPRSVEQPRSGDQRAGRENRAGRLTQVDRRRERT
jgi:hypothetical protein